METIDLKTCHLNERDFVRYNNNQNQEHFQQCRLRFKNFITRFISTFTNPTLDGLLLTLSNPDQFQQETALCIDFALRRRVRALGLDFSHPNWTEHHSYEPLPVFSSLPSNLYDPSNNFLYLKFFSCKVNLSNLMHFTSLREISLGWMPVNIRDINSLLVHCPLLDSLTLKKCWDMEDFDIQPIPNRDLRLRTLVLDKCRFNYVWVGMEAKDLRTFKYSGEIGIFELSLARCTQEVDLDFCFEDEFEDCGHLIQKLFVSLEHVRRLTVCSYTLQIVPTGEEPLRMQNYMNVRHLTLKTGVHASEVWGIAFMMKSCRLLETLTIQICTPKIFNDYKPPFSGNFNPYDHWNTRCVRSTLKTVVVKGFKGSQNELLLLRTIIRFGNVLKEVHIHVSDEELGEGEQAQQTKQFREDEARSVMSFKKVSNDLNVLVH